MARPRRELDPLPRAILLDALGTLVALEPPAPRLRAELASRFGIEVTEDQAGQAIAAEIAYYRAHLDEGRDPDSLVALRRRCAGVLWSALSPGEVRSGLSAGVVRSGLPTGVVRSGLSTGQVRSGVLAGEVDLDRVTEALLASLRFTAFSDVPPALRAARARGQRLVVVSNWDTSLNGVLAGLGLAPLLDGIVTSAVAGARKPSPAIFGQALALAGAAPGEAVHVGDSLEEDVAGARAAGIEPVLIRRHGGGAVDGVRTISSLADLVDG